MNDLTDKVVVITGASSGIGRATAAEFAKQGARVVLAARDTDGLREAEIECKEQGGKTLMVTTDVTDEAAVEKLADRAEGTFGRIDIWVNNAGVGLFGKFEDTPSEDFHRVMDTDFFGYVYGARAALKRFKAQGSGLIINVDSIEGIAPKPYNAAYASAKHAVRALASSLRMELALAGAKTIQVATVVPASVDTPLFAHSANYTGQAVRAPETSTAPTEVALAIVKLARKPQRELVLGAAKKSIMQYLMAPSQYESKTATQFPARHLGSDTAVRGKGNLYGTTEPHAINGGWRREQSQPNLKKALPWLAIAGVAAAGGIATWMITRGKGKDSAKTAARTVKVALPASFVRQFLPSAKTG